eukprot:6491460-Amphidinium_carterae.1
MSTRMPDGVAGYVLENGFYKYVTQFAGERRPLAIARLPQVYRLWCALCRQDVKAWRARCTGQGEVPVGRGALDKTFDLAFDTERTTAAGKPQAGIFLDCSKCYERVPLSFNHS